MTWFHVWADTALREASARPLLSKSNETQQNICHKCHSPPLGTKGIWHFPSIPGNSGSNGCIHASLWQCLCWQQLPRPHLFPLFFIRRWRVIFKTINSLCGEVSKKKGQMYRINYFLEAIFPLRDWGMFSPPSVSEPVCLFLSESFRDNSKKTPQISLTFWETFIPGLWSIWQTFFLTPFANWIQQIWDSVFVPTQ